MIKPILALAIPVAFGAGLLVGTNTPTTSEPTYALVLTALNNNEYVVDYNLSKADCSQRMRDYFDFDENKGVACEKEPLQ